MPLPVNIKNLIENETIESERIEFKEGWNPKPILCTIDTFANDFSNIGGGYITVGVAAIQKELLQIYHNITPNYFPVVETGCD